MPYFDNYLRYLIARHRAWLAILLGSALMGAFISYITIKPTYVWTLPIAATDDVDTYGRPVPLVPSHIVDALRNETLFVQSFPQLTEAIKTYHHAAFESRNTSLRMYGDVGFSCDFDHNVPAISLRLFHNSLPISAQELMDQVNRAIDGFNEKQRQGRENDVENKVKNFKALANYEDFLRQKSALTTKQEIVSDKLVTYILELKKVATNISIDMPALNIAYEVVRLDFLKKEGKLSEASFSKFRKSLAEIQSAQDKVDQEREVFQATKNIFFNRVLSAPVEEIAHNYVNDYFYLVPHLKAATETFTNNGKPDYRDFILSTFAFTVFGMILGLFFFSLVYLRRNVI